MKEQRRKLYLSYHLQHEAQNTNLGWKDAGWVVIGVDNRTQRFEHTNWLHGT